ncbi:alpha/beta hydrolase [Patulibacter sp. NPDC049589]|uniref:alpha/beta fold hydrolase n=1 Tax=Patulibacter sp. NPDC049589 TaxID=3154731 RepID=UPI003415B821
MREEQVEVPGGSLWTVTHGLGPPLVLCHGGPGLSDNLGPLASLIDDEFRVHRFDQRGAGRSSTSGPFDVPTFVADLEVLRRHWGHDRWVVGGHSWGATLAVLYALAHPDRVDAVLYVAGTGIRWGWQEETRRHRLARLTDAERAELALLESQDHPLSPDAQRRVLRLMWQTDFADPARAAEVLAREPLYAFPRDPRVFREVSASLKHELEGPVETSLRHLAAPVLVLHGDHDADPSRTRRVADLAPAGRFCEIERAGHSPWLEQPDAVGTAIRQFLSESPSEPAGMQDGHRPAEDAR